MDTRKRWLDVAKTFDMLVERSPSDRSATLRGLDVTLRAEVEALLARADAGSDGVPQIIARAVARTKRPTAPMVGRRIGAYQIVRQLGEGGMGAVYLAERADDQYRGAVAIKVLHHGVETEAAVARFRDERQILASLDHPNIVRLVDGGTTVEHLPYLAMEYVEGKPITKFARDRGLDVRARADLFRAVCAAIHFAHRKLIVHRDLKPSNILVTADGTPKLLDFGIAKLLGDTGPHSREAKTRTGMLLLTPEYASPEQARGESVGTATDVYSLGAVLYELMCDAPPHRSAASGLAGMLQAIERVPDRPSTVAPVERRREIAGDLDNIILKALEKDPARRYASADHMAEDLERFLEGKPVDARAPTWRYRATKFVRRNRIAVAAGATVVIALAIATAVSIAQARRANAEADVAAAASARAESEAKTARERFADVKNLADKLLFEIDDKLADLPNATGARELIVSEALAYLDRLAVDARGDDALLRDLAKGYMKIGDIQGSPLAPSLGRSKDAIASYDKARAILDEPVAVVDKLARDRVELDYLVGRGRLSPMDASNVDLLERALTLAQRLPQDAATLQLEVRADLALADRARFLQASNQLELARRVESTAARWVAADPSSLDASFSLATAHEAIGEALLATADVDAAVTEVEEARRIVAALVEKSPTSQSYRRELRYETRLLATADTGVDTFPFWNPTTGRDSEGVKLLHDVVDAARSEHANDAYDLRGTFDLADAEVALALAPVPDPVALELLARSRDRVHAVALPQVPVLLAMNACASVKPLAATGRASEARAAIDEAVRSRPVLEDIALATEACDFLIARGQSVLGDRDAAITTLRGVVDKLHTADAGSLRARIGLAQAFVEMSTLEPEHRCADLQSAHDVWRTWKGASTAYVRRELEHLDQLSTTAKCSRSAP